MDSAKVIGRGYVTFERGAQAAAGTAPAQPAALPRPAGFAGILIIKASYGDGRRDCDVTGWAASRFNGRASARLNVNNEICGDPAPGARKSLRVSYLCDGEEKSTSANEHRSVSLDCSR